jgi:hypothetical protein
MKISYYYQLFNFITLNLKSQHYSLIRNFSVAIFNNELDQSPRFTFRQIKRINNPQLVHLWDKFVYNPIPNNTYTYRYKQDCAYVLQGGDNMAVFDTIDSELYLWLDLLQYNCYSTNALLASSISHDNMNMTQGGSSFEAVWVTDRHMASCHSQDHFNNTYSLYCPICSKQPTNADIINKNKYCGVVHITFNTSITPPSTC